MSEEDHRGGKRNRPLTGLTLAEVLVSVIIFSIIAGAFYQMISVALASWKDHQERENLFSDGRLALEEMVRHIRATNQVLIPLRDGIPRNVLAMAEMLLDSDQDGLLDADNDRDGKINEDWGDDMTGDGAPGIIGIDDDNDGLVDEGDSRDDDEDGAVNEDPWDSLDNDADSRVDEDTSADRENDNSPGISGFDDNGDSIIDNGAGRDDDDEDNFVDEDPIDPVVFYWNTATNQIIQRLPNYATAPFNDYIEAPIVGNVKSFAVTRATQSSGVLVTIALVLESPGGPTVTLGTRVLARRYP